MAKKSGDQVAGLIKEVEVVAKRIRADLRERAAMAAGQVEKYAHQVRKELEGAGGKSVHRSKSSRSGARRKAAAVAQ